jgi:hypothetical protein
VSLAIYSKIARPAVAAVVACGVLTTVQLWYSEPVVSAGDPDVLRGWLVGVLAVFGVLVPGVLALLPQFTTATWWGVLTFFLALTANAVVFGARTVGFPATFPMLVALAVSLATCTIVLVTAAERQAAKPPQSKL